METPLPADDMRAWQTWSMPTVERRRDDGQPLVRAVKQPIVTGNDLP